MLSDISYKTLIDWAAFAELEPFDEMREDYRNANIVSALYHFVNFGKRRSRKPLRDFMLTFGDSKEARPKPGWQDLKAMGKMMADAFNAEERKRTRKRRR